MTVRIGDKSCRVFWIRGGAKRDGNVKRNERIRKDMVAVGECKQVDRLVDSGGGGVGGYVRAAVSSNRYLL